jgi:glucose-1-phosphate cytidylyltransferase
MKVVILCGGQGTRIRDVADDVPKPMITIGDKPILWHIMMTYAQHGFKEFVLCLGYKGWTIKQFFLDYHLAHADITVQLSRLGDVKIEGSQATEDWKVTLVETGLQSMTGHRIKQIEPYIDGNEFMLTYGDGLADVDLTSLLAFHRAHGRLATVTTVRAPGRFGELNLTGNQVMEFAEKPAISAGWISGGFFVCHRRIFEGLSDDPNLVFEFEPLRQLAWDGELMAFKHTGFWQAMDNSREYRLLNELWERGQAPWKTWSNPAPTLRAA